MSVCTVRGKRAWYKIEATMRDTGEKVVIDRIDRDPAPVEISPEVGYVYYQNGERHTINGFSEFDLFVVWEEEEEKDGCAGCLRVVPSAGEKTS